MVNSLASSDQASNVPALAGIPRLPFDNGDQRRTARMLVISAVWSVAQRREANGDEGPTPDELRDGFSSVDEAVAHLASAEWHAEGASDPAAGDPNEDPSSEEFIEAFYPTNRAWDVLNVRRRLQRMAPVPGIDVGLADVERLIADEEIQTAVDAVCRPKRRPRKDEPKLPKRWDHIAGVLIRVGLLDTPDPHYFAVAVESLERDWWRWDKAIRLREGPA